MKRDASVKPFLERTHYNHATLLVPHFEGDCRVVCGFTERTGGVSQAPYDSLNLATHVDDNPVAVAQNRIQLFSDLDIPAAVSCLVTPHQVHGTDIVVLDKMSKLSESLRGFHQIDSVSHHQAFNEALAQTVAFKRCSVLDDCLDNSYELSLSLEHIVIPSCDAVVCNRSDTVVLLCFADCVPVLLCTSHAFAVIHSGWKGTYGHIAAQALQKLLDLEGCSTDKVMAFIGPAIGVENYEVSPELADQFKAQWPERVVRDDNHLNLSEAIITDLIAAGLSPSQIVDSKIDTTEHQDRFFSYRASGGRCGRHAAVAFLKK